MLTNSIFLKYLRSDIAARVISFNNEELTLGEFLSFNLADDDAPGLSEDDIIAICELAVGDSCPISVHAGFETVKRIS
jgi:hypothetical protein